MYTTVTSTTGGLATKAYVDANKVKGIKILYPSDFTSRIMPDIYYNGSYYADITADSYKLGGGSDVWVATDGNDTTGDGSENNPYLTITKAIATSGVTTIHIKEGTYEQGTHYTSGTDFINKNVIGHGTVILQNNSSGGYSYTSGSSYFENIVFKHGNATTNSAFSAVCSATGKTVCFVGCVFRDGGTNGLNLTGIDAVLINCMAFGNRLDGFNYHARTVSDTTYIPNILEINCVAYNNGTSSSGSDSCNGSTAHDGSKIVRLNGEYYSCYGGVIAEIGLDGDVETTMSVNFGVIAHNSTGVNDYAASFWASYNTKMYLYDCTSYGSTYDISVLNDGIIVYRDLKTKWASTAIKKGASASVIEVPEAIREVQLNGTKVSTTNGVANIPLASSISLGVVKADGTYGVEINSSGRAQTSRAVSSQVKAGVSEYKPITPYYQHEAAFYGMAKAAGDTTQSQSSNPVGTYTDAAKIAIRNMLGSASVADIAPMYDSTATYDLGEYVIYNGTFYRCTTAITTAEAWDATHWTLATIGEILKAIPTGGTTGQVLRKQSNDDFIANWSDETVKDVQINGTSILSQGVANVPVAEEQAFGVIRRSTRANGLLWDTSGYHKIATAYESEAKAGTNSYNPITPSNQDRAAFYGFAKVAGSDESGSTLALGTYTENAKSAISAMLNAPESKTGTTVSITAKSGIRYKCGEVATLDIVVPASGLFEVDFESGSTATVLTTTGATVTWPAWFDPTDLEADTLYEISIQDGRGLVATWPA